MEPYERRDTDGEDYMRAMEATRKHLPNLRKIIDKWKYLNIQKQHAEMLIALYKMLDTKELSLSKLLTSEKFIIKLSNNYHKFLEEECTLDAKNTNKLDGCENKTNSSSEINLTMKKIDLNLDSMWDIPNNNMATSSNTDNFTHNYQLKSVDYDFKRKKEGINKDKDATLPEFSDSRLQVNELIGLEAIEKLDTADESISNTLSLHSQPQFIVSSVLSKSSTVPDKLNTDINVFHKIGSSNDPKQKLITPLKPDTLIDHTNSKLTRASLLMESIRSVVPSNNKNTDDKRFQRPDNGSQHDSLSVYNGQTSQKAKYGKGKYSNYSDRIDQKEKVGQCMLNLENQKFKSSNRTNAKESTSSFGVKNSTDKIINCKIPIIKHIEELIEQNTKKNMTETVIIKNNFKINSLTDTIEDNALKKSSATEIITNCKIEKKLKTGTINDDDKIESGNDKSHEISLKKSVINIDNKDEKKIAKKQCHIIKESTRAKKIKMCSEETEVEKIVKEASSLKEDTCGPKIRTRSSLKKIGEPLKEVVPNKKRICLDIREHSENIEYVENVNTEQDVILSTSIEESEGVTPIKRECTNFEESIVSSNELSSTVDTRTNPIYLSSKVDLQNPGILTIFELLRDEQKQLKLKEFLNATDTKNIRDDEPKCKNVSSEEHSHFEHNKLKEKKGRKLDKNNTIVVKNSSNNQESKNALLNTCLDNDFNKGSMVIENSNSGINFDHSSTSQGKVKLSKQKKLKKNYGNFKIKNKNLPDNEIQDLKVVITRCDKNSSFTDKNDQFKIRPNYEIISKEKSNKSNCKLKNKKIKTNEIEEKDVPSVLAKPQKKDPINENPTLGISTLQDQYNTIDQSSEKMTTLQSNVNNTTVRKRTKRYITEIEKLRLGAGQAYGSDDVLHERRIRKCRQNKKIDYCYTNTVVLSEKNNSSTIEQLDDQANISISNNKKSKTFKKQTKNKKKTIQVKTLKALTPEDFKDKLYFQTVDNKLECKLCSYNDIGLKIVRHYKEDHSVEEMLPSRLSVDIAEILINESVKENFGILNVLDLKPLSDVVLVNINLTCVFCYSIFYDITCFYDHITCHTGEYRYNCKVCKMTYPNVLELDKHISEHTNYDKSEGIFHLSQSNSVGSNTIFGYLCPFCYYIQLDYQRTLNHMIERHFNEDKKLNSYWTIIRVNMSIGDNDYTNSIVDYSNLVGCLPLILNNKVILKDENQTQQTGVSTIVAKKKQAMKNAGSSGIPLYNEVEVHLPKLNINSLVNKTRACNEKFTTITDEPTFEHKEYTLKYNLKKCIVADLSCELVHSVLVYKCSVLKCQYNQFSTVVINELFKHINLNHQNIVWDRKCDMCKQKVDNLNEQYLLKDALEHIISHHLVLKKIHQPKIISNVQDVEKGQKSPTIATVKSKEMGSIRVIRSLRERDDLLSTATEQSNSIQVSNNTILSVPPVSFQIQDVRSLKESKNCITNGNKTCYEIKYQYEVTNSRATLVGSNQQIVNKGVPINGTYCLIDTMYQKNYLNKFKEFGANAMRSQLILKDMTTMPKLFTLFKCMDKSCTDVFSDKAMFELHMQLHFSNMGKNKKNQINNSEQFKHCVYCFKQFDDGESLATHILKNYSFCKYFCPFCFYRAYTPLHVLFHQNLLHNTKNSNIIQLENDYSEEILMAVDYNDFVMPYKCNVGLCIFSCFVSNDFIYHLNKEHPQCDKFCCHICGFQDNSKEFIAFKPNLLIEHFKDHHLNTYQCIFCLFGTETMNSMISHLAMEHFEYDSLCLERSVKSGCCDSSKVGNLNIIRTEALIHNDLLKIVNFPSGMSSLSENLTERTQIKQSNYAITKSKNSANIVENTQSSPAIVIQIPANEKMMERSNSLELVNYNQINILDDDQNHLKKNDSAKLQFVAENKNMISFSPDTIDNIPMTDYFPSSMACSLCPNFTTRVRSILIRHLKAHQRKRDNTTKEIVNPVKRAIVEPHPPFIELNKQNVEENIIVDGRSMTFKNKSTDKTDFAKLQNIAKNKNMISFSPDTIDNIPMTDYFPSPIRCSLCPNFTTKVRFNLIRHLKAHQRKLDNTTKEIVNPVTSITKSGPMFDKTTTLSGSSFEATNPEKVERAIVEPNPLSIELNKQNAEENIIVDGRSMTFKNKSTGKTDFAKLQNIAENKNMISFSPDTIDNIPMTDYFPRFMACSLCPNFTTRVRSILIRHLKAHQRKRDNTSKETVNPVTSKRNSGPMIEKTISLSASSIEFMNPEKVERGIVQQHSKAIELNKQNAEKNVIVDGSSMTFKNKSTGKTDFAKLQNIVENKNMISFSPDTIDNIPMTDYFPSFMACSLCLNFTTRVRSILIRHLKAHQRKRDNTTKEIVNPITSKRNSGPMFEKTTTLSASSIESMNPEKVERGIVQQHSKAMELNKQNAEKNVIVDGRSIIF